MNPNQNSLLSGPDVEAPGCLGNLFPDFSQLTRNRVAHGSAFDVLVESQGFGVQRKTITFKPEAWDACVHSPQFEECYRLSMAKLLLEMRLDRIN